MSNLTLTRPRVAFGQAIHEAIPAPAAVTQSLAFLFGVKRGLVYNIFQSYNNFLADARNKICKQTLDSGGTHLLFLDTDIVCPPDVLNKLLAHEKDVVGGLYHARLAPYKPVMFRRTLEGPEYMEPIEDHKPGEVKKVDYLGMGCTLIKTSLLSDMSMRYKDTRWFQFQDGHGEDIWFANRCKEMGVSLHVDTGLRLGHCSSCVIVDEHYQAAKADPENPHLNDPTYHFQSVTGDKQVRTRRFEG